MRQRFDHEHSDETGANCTQHLSEDSSVDRSIERLQGQIYRLTQEVAELKKRDTEKNPK